MVNSVSRRYMSMLILGLAPFVTFIMNPWNSYDGINIPKFSFLVFGAAIVLALLFVDIKLLLDSRFRLAMIISAVFKIDLLFVLLVDSGPFNEQFFGTNGRNTGYLTYVCLVVLFFATVISFDKKRVGKLLWSLLAIGSLSLVYGLLQSVKLDPFKWNNPYSPVLGFLGNPDFQSSFLGICAVAALALVCAKKASVKMRAALATYLLISAYVIYRTKAQQGFLVFIAGAMLVLFFVLHKNEKTEKLSFAYLPVVFVSGVLVVMGSLNKGPLAQYLYKVSVTYRGDYWRAAWKMTTGHPFTGIGLDSYGNWYRSVRTLESTLRRGPEVTSNAAHNVFLDFSSNGGFPLLIAYLLIVGYAFFSAMKTIKRSEGFDAPLIALFGAWFAYQVQSVISINQIGLAVWGWVLSGALIAYEISTRENTDVVTPKNAKPGRQAVSRSLPQSSGPSWIAITIGVIIGLALSLPPYLADASLRSALRSGLTTNLEKAVKQSPMDETRLFYGAQLLGTSKQEANALALSQLAAKRDPRFYYAWQQISTNPTATAAQKADALAHMKALDPHNPNLK